MSKKNRPISRIHPNGDTLEILETLEEIIERRFEINQKGVNGLTPLHYAAMLSAHFELEKVEVLISTLLELGANKETLDNDGLLPLNFLYGPTAIVALQSVLRPSDGFDMSRFVFDSVYLDGSDIDSENPDCLRILETIPEIGVYESIKLGGGKLVHSAAFSGNVSALRFLFAQGFDLNVKDSHFEKPIHIAASKGYPNTVQALIELGVDVNSIARAGNTPLHSAASSLLPSDKTSVIKALVNGGADLEIQNRSGETPLHEAIIFKNKREIRCLVDCGANVNALNRDGEMPLELANEMNLDSETVAFLIANGAV